jgi:VWFA-related protein
VQPVPESEEKKPPMQNPLSRIPFFVTLRVSVCLLVMLMLPLFGADKPQKPSPESPATQTFKVAVDLVSVNVSVTDKKGNLIKDLTQNDFQVFEEGVPQQISVFKVEATPGVVISVPTEEGGAASTTPPLTPLSRKIVLFVDDYHIQFENLVRLKRAGEDFIRNALGPTDQVALITASGKNSTEFTKYREYVIANLNAIFPLAQSRRPVSDCPPLTDYQAYLIGTNEMAATDAITAAIPATIRCASLDGLPTAVDMARAMIISAGRGRAMEITEDSRRTLFGIQNLARRLRAFEGRKILVFLSDGLLTQDILFQLQETIDAAIRANTVIYSINTKGLDATPLGGDISSPIPMMSGEEVRIHSFLASEDRFRSEDALNALASGTGGALFHNNNDMLGQLKTVVNRVQVSYVLGYYSTNTRRDGRFRKISVKVVRPDMVVSARQGYFAPKGDETFRREKNEDVREALQSAEDLKEIPVAIAFNITRSDLTRSLVGVQTRIDVRKIHFQKRENRNQNIFNIVTVVYDANKRFVDGRETQIDFNLSDPNYKNVMQEGLRNQATFRLEPGNYIIKIVVREAGETKLGSATQTLEVVN